MRSDLQLIQSAIASEDLRKEDTERITRPHIQFLHVYTVDLPDKFRGLPTVWIFAILPQQNSLLTTEDRNRIVEEARQLVRESTGHPQDTSPIVLISDVAEFHFGQELSFKDKAVFFLDRFELPGKESFPKMASQAPILLSARRSFKASGTSYLLSPYSPFRPVDDWRFFGRRREVRTILESRSNFFVIGSRRIGKTSLLQQVALQMQKRGETVHWIEVQTKSDFQEVIDEIAQNLIYRDLQQAQRSGRNIDLNYLTTVLRKLKGDKKNIVLFLDEIGNVIAKSPNDSWKFFGVLRELSHNNEIRVIASAFQEVVIKQLRNSQGPFVNFANITEIYAFSQTEIEELLIDPLLFWARIKDKTRLSRRIKRGFGGHPLILQVLGNKLFELINDNEASDIEEFVDNLLRGEELNYFRQAIEEIFEKMTSYLERYLYLRLCIDIDAQDRELVGVDITQESIQVILEDLGIVSDMDHRKLILQRLCLRGWMSQDQSNFQVYRIDCPIIYRYTKVFNPPVTRLIENYRKEIHMGTLNMEEF